MTLEGCWMVLDEVLKLSCLVVSVVSPYPFVFTLN